MRKEELQRQATRLIKQPEDKSIPQPTEKNASAQRLIKAMGQPAHVTPDDIEFLIKIIKEAKKSTRISRSEQSVLTHESN